ncbi:MFS transporter [Halomarina litorea]|uniref:MFS transporter n=1 Tax=Halomarina litorea TaxID=2961595 RepID=UPI0020C44A90|nr:MFS transporter [Halomarina sp. BCD28]
MSPSRWIRSRSRWRWVLWAALAGGFLLVNFHRVSSAVLADDLTRAFDTTGTELGLLHSSFFYIYAALQLPAGLLVDRAGVRRVAAAGLAIMSVGVVGFALADSLLAGFLARALVGLGGSVLYIATLRFCANWFRRDEFATMTGWTVAAAGLGGVLATTPLALAVVAVGWRGTLLATAVGGGSLAGVIYLLVRDRPRDGGFDPVEGADPPERRADLATVAANTRRVLRERETWLLGVMLFFVIGTNFTVLGLWGVPYIAHVYDVSVARASTYVLLGNVGLLVGPPVMGTLSDRLGRRTDIILASTVAFTLAYGTVFAVVTPPLPVFGALLFLALFTNGGTLLAYTVAKERHANSASGTVTGTINSIGYFGAAVFPALMGVALDTYWTGTTIDGARVYTATGYRVAFGIATAAGCVAVCCAAWLHLRLDGAPSERAATADD